MQKLENYKNKEIKNEQILDSIKTTENIQNNGNFQNFQYNQTFQNNQNNFQNFIYSPMTYQGNYYNINNQNIFQNNGMNMNQMNSNFINLNMNEINMNNHINKNMNLQDKNDIVYEDIYPDILTEKINIKFIFPYETKYVQIPLSLSQNELYYTAEILYSKSKKIFGTYYEMDEVIKLYYSDYKLENDDSPIDFIPKFGTIKVSFDLPEYDFYIDYLFEKYKNSKIIVLTFEYNSDDSIINVPRDINFEEMIKTFCYKNYINFSSKDPFKNFMFINNHKYERLEYNDKNKNKALFEIGIDNGAKIMVVFTNDVIIGCARNEYPGKDLHVSIKDENFNLKFNFHAGTLEKIKDFYRYLNLYLNESEKTKIKENLIIYPGKIELKNDDERTFSSIGIRNDFTCIIKTTKN